MHIYTPRPFIFTLFTCLYDDTLQRYSLKKLMFRKTADLESFGHIRQTSGNWMWPKLPKGTSSCQYLSFAPTPMSIRPSVTKEQPRNAHISKNRCFWTFWPNSAIFGGQNCQKAHLNAKTFHMSQFPVLYDHPLQRYSLEKNRWRTDRRTDGHPESIGP